MKYFRATSVAEAASAVTAGVTALAGGTALVPEIARDGGGDQTFVDIGQLGDLGELRLAADHALLGSLATLDRIAENDSLQRDFCTLTEAARAVGNPQVRRAATLGGNVALAHAGADLLPALLALEAEILFRDRAGECRLPVSEFAATGRLITGVKIPLRRTARSAFRKFAWRRASGITIVHCAAVCTFERNVVASARLIGGGAGMRALRLAAAEEVITSHELTPALIAEAAEAAQGEIGFDPAGWPSAAYRRRLLAAGIRETLTKLNTP